MFSYIKRQVKEQDFFGAPVTLTIGGKDAYNTVCGGLVTIMVILAVVV